LKKKNTYEATDITDNGASEHMSSLHHKCIRTNKYVWDMMKVLDKEEMYGFHFETKVGKTKTLVILYHDEKVALNKAQKLLRNVEKNGDILFLTKLREQKKKSRLGLVIFISILFLVMATVILNFLYKMGHFEFMLEASPSTQSVQSSNIDTMNENNDEPIVEEIVVDIQKLELLKEGFEEQNNSELAPEVLHALTLTTGIISGMVSEEEKAKYSSEAVVANFKGKNGIKLVVKDDGSNKDFNRSVKALNNYAMNFIKENNLSEALNYYDQVAKEHNLSNEEAMMNAQYKGEIFERMGLNEEAKSSYEQALSLSKVFLENNQTLDGLAFLDDHNVSEILSYYDKTLGSDNGLKTGEMDNGVFQEKLLNGLDLSELFKEQNQTIITLNELVNLGHLSQIYEDLNETKRAKEISQKAQNLYKLLIIELKKYGEVKSEELALTLNYLADFYANKDEALLAIEMNKEALKIYDTLVKKSSEKFALSFYKNLNTLGTRHLQVGHIKVAKQHYQEAFQFMEELIKSKTVENNAYLALSYRALAQVAIQENRLEEAQKHYENALAIYHDLQKQEKAYNFHITDMHGELAKLYTLKKKLPLAKQAYQEGIYQFTEMNKESPSKYCLKIAKLLNSSAKMKVSNYDMNSTEIVESKLELRESIEWAKKGIETNFKEAKQSMIESYAYLAYIAGKNQNMTLAKKYYKTYYILKKINGLDAFKSL
jgi:tetratricopeptide (TPR) repeat protein